MYSQGVLVGALQGVVVGEGRVYQCSLQIQQYQQGVLVGALHVVVVGGGQVQLCSSQLQMGVQQQVQLYSLLVEVVGVGQV